MKANRTGKYNEPPQIEDLKDGTFYYNFNVEKDYIKTDNSPRMDVDWNYNQVRLPYPLNIDKIQAEVTRQGYKHKLEF